jgi:uncharacterized OB-fold protein
MHEPRPFGAVTPDQFRRIREIFESALDQPIADRHAWLEAVCGSDTALLRQVERMLVADDKRHHLLDRSADATHEAVSVVCPSCGATVIAAQRFCPSCGTPTAAVGPLTGGRFRAGALFAGRFRIIALQGRGGMGQVYRAQDLEVGQPVALKFLTAFRSDERARNRLRKEVRWRGRSRIQTSAVCTTSVRRAASFTCRWSMSTAKIWRACSNAFAACCG